MVFKIIDIIILSSLRCGCCTQHLCVHRVPGRRGSEMGVFGFLARHPPKAPFPVYGLARRHAGVSVRFPRAGLCLMSFMLSLVVCVVHRSGQHVLLYILYPTFCQNVTRGVNFFLLVSDKIRIFAHRFTFFCLATAKINQRADTTKCQPCFFFKSPEKFYRTPIDCFIGLVFS